VNEIGFKSYYVVWKPIGHYQQKKFEATV